jgi:ABC-2 type transport system permease protein
MSLSASSIAKRLPPGFCGLLWKEMLRFWRVAAQTVLAPVLGTFLYLLIFSHILSDKVRVFDGAPYTDFLLPGLVMMSVLQNAFANSSSSLVQSRVTGNITLVLLPPISPGAFYLAYALAGLVRGLAVGVGVFACGFLFVSPPIAAPLWIAVFAIAGGVMTASLGIIAGLWAERFDQMALFQNFIIMPLTFLSGVFYSLDSLPPFWRAASALNPFFYLIDGFRYGFFLRSDSPVWINFSVAAGGAMLLAAAAFYLLRIGYKLRT